MSIGRVTHSSDLISFFKMVAPISTEIPLIRIGFNSDGGYLVPDDLVGLDCCFSPGVALTSSFEEDLANRGIRSFMADYSVEKLPIENNLFFFKKKFIGLYNDDKFIRLEDWITENRNSTQDCILQMDIEGYEYLVLNNTPLSILSNFRILVIEFHNLELLHTKESFPLLNGTFKRLLEIFSIVHIHPNNSSLPYKFKNFSIPSTMEFTFLRKDRFKLSNLEKSFPHKLDRDNTGHLPSIKLPECWWNL